MITEITITGPRNKKKKKKKAEAGAGAATAAAERVNKWQSKLWRDCQNKCEAIYEIFMKCDMADNKYIFEEGHPPPTSHRTQPTEPRFEQIPQI